MDNPIESLNRLMVEVFNDILEKEEAALKSGAFCDVSITEVHTIEAIGMYGRKTMTEISRSLDVTIGTLSVAINNLVRKDYVERFRSESDRRQVQVGLTKKGRLLYRIHDKFHIEMVKSAIRELTKEEGLVLARVLKNLHEFFTSKFLSEK